jgi:hypothetical protein
MLTECRSRRCARAVSAADEAIRAVLAAHLPDASGASPPRHASHLTPDGDFILTGCWPRGDIVASPCPVTAKFAR